MLKLAYCGDNCNLCPWYIASQTNSAEKLYDDIRKCAQAKGIVPNKNMNVSEKLSS